MNNNREWELYRANRCPKCGYASDTPFEICRSCGVVVEKFLLREERIKRGATRPSEAVREEPAGICRTLLYIITRTWLWPVPIILIHLWVFLTSDTIWTTEVAVNVRNVGGGEGDYATAGIMALLRLVLFTLFYWLTYAPILRFGSRSEISDFEAGLGTMLLRVLILLALCWSTYGMVRFG